MNRIFKCWVAGSCALLLSFGCSKSPEVSKTNTSANVSSSPETSVPLRTLDAGLGKGVNLANMLDAPSEGDWGLTVKETYFATVANAGFDHIRMPISWPYHADTEAPYTIDEEFFERVDWCVEQATKNNLKIILNLQHYSDIHEDPVAETDRAVGIWKQIAERYQDQPDSVYFEILNEPNEAFNEKPQLWQELMSVLLAEIRKSNPTRKILVGPTQWNKVSGLSDFDPPDDPNLIATMHYYDPFPFTHQGAHWMDPPLPTGMDWTGRPMVIASPWEDWSWDCQLESADEGLRIDFQEGSGGLRFHHPDGVEGMNGLSFRMHVDAEFKIEIKDGDENSWETVVKPERGFAPTVVEIGGDLERITDVVFQSATDEALDPFLLKDATLTGTGESLSISATEAENIKLDLERLVRWGTKHQIPVHLGEFGVYEAAETAARVRWMAAVREQCDRLKIDWTYWEFANGFGIYDPQKDEWRAELLEALLPKDNRSDAADATGIDGP